MPIFGIRCSRSTGVSRKEMKADAELTFFLLEVFGYLRWSSVPPASPSRTITMR